MSESAEIRKATKTAVQNAEIACRNEILTRRRVERLERVFERVYHMTIYDRLKWLLFGFPELQPEKPKASEPVTQGLAQTGEVQSVH